MPQNGTNVVMFFLVDALTVYARSGDSDHQPEPKSRQPAASARVALTKFLMDARVLYRRLYRELSFQALEASKAQTAQLKRREAALAAYRKRLAEQKQAQAEGRNVANPSPALSKRLSAGPLYDSKALRECFAGAAKDPKQTLEYGHEVWEYLRSQRTYKDLIARYNPGATMDDEERIRLSAQRVGLALPKTMREQLDIIY